MVRPVGPWLVPCGVLIRSKGPVFVLQVPSSPRGALICSAELRFVLGSWSAPCGRDPSIRTWSVHGALTHSRDPDPFLGSWSVPGALIRPGDLICPQGPDLSCGVLIRLAGPVFVPWIPGSSCQAVTCLTGPDSSCRAMSRGPWFVSQALIRLPGPDSSFWAPICPVGPWYVSLARGKWQRTYLRLGRFSAVSQNWSIWVETDTQWWTIFHSHLNFLGEFLTLRWWFGISDYHNTATKAIVHWNNHSFLNEYNLPHYPPNFPLPPRFLRPEFRTPTPKQGCNFGTLIFCHSPNGSMGPVLVKGATDMPPGALPVGAWPGCPPPRDRHWSARHYMPCNRIVLRCVTVLSN